MKCRLRLREL